MTHLEQRMTEPREESMVKRNVLMQNDRKRSHMRRVGAWEHEAFFALVFFVFVANLLPNSLKLLLDKGQHFLYRKVTRLSKSAIYNSLYRFSSIYICSFLLFLAFSRVFLATNLDTIWKVWDFRLLGWRRFLILFQKLKSWNNKLIISVML